MACLPWPTSRVKHTDLQLARKPQVAAHTPPAKLGQSDLQLARKAAGGCPHTREIQDNRTYSLQQSRRWLPTHLQNPRQPDLQLARYANTEHPDQQLASKPRVAAHTPAGVGVCRKIIFHACNIQLVSSIAATRYLRGLPPGHTAASNIWIAHCNLYLPARSCACLSLRISQPVCQYSQTDRNQTSTQKLLKLNVTTLQ